MPYLRCHPHYLTWALLLLTAWVLQGCAFATLEHLLVERNSGWVQVGGEISVTREGKLIDVKVGDPLKKGDIIETGHDTSALISFMPSSFMPSSEVVLRPSTRIEILNPSLYAYFGELFVKVKGVFEVSFVYGTAGSEGTEYVVKVDPGGQAKVTVLEGQVKLFSKLGGWQSIRLGPRQQAALSAAHSPVTRRLEQSEFNAIISWINEIYSATGSDDISMIVPDVGGMQKHTAIAQIQRERLRVGTIGRRLTQTATVDSVLGQNPIANTRVPIHSMINIEVEAEPTTVPSLLGRTQQHAEQRLRRSRLRLGRIERILSDDRVGTIARQSPSAGNVVMVDSAVDVAIVAESAIVPNLQGMQLQKARNQIFSSKLSLGRVDHRMTGNAAVDQVLSQQPAPGTRVFSQSEVTLVVEADSTLIPNLVGQNQLQAQQLLNAQRLSLGSVQTQRVRQSEAGTVLYQSPPAGTRVAPGSRVDITVAAQVITVPNLIGNHYQGAVQTLQSSNLILGRVDNRLEDRYTAGTVIDQYPRAGTLVDPQSSVSLVLAEAGVRVPSVVNQPLQQAISILSNNGLGYSTNYQETDRYATNTVMGQSIAVNTLVRRGTQVMLTVSREIIKCTVPNVTGNYAQALQTLSRAGFRAYTQGVSDGTAYVRSQSPAANSRVRCGSTVTLFTTSIRIEQ